MMTTPKLLLAASSLILVLAGVAHAVAFRRALPAVAASELAPFYSGSFKSLWLIDSANCVILAGLFGVFAAHPSVAMRPVIVALALMPAASAFFIYRFLGSFYAGHVLLAAAVSALVGGLTVE